MARPVPIHDLVTHAAQGNADRVAVLDATRSLTYAQLERAAGHVAALLARRGIGGEQTVGVLAPRCVELVAAVVGILRAGAAYVPMDPSHPDERLEYMVRDADVQIVLATGELAQRAARFGRRGLRLEDALEDAPPADSHPQTQDGQLAYVLYTSGSTGQPKGVCVEHGAIAEYVLKVAELFRVTAGDRVLQFSSIGFDPFFSEVFPALSKGASVYLRPDGMIDSVQRFVRSVERERLTLLNIPTPYWHELSAALHGEQVQLPDHVRLVVVGGDRALPARLADWYLGAPPTASLMHVYGPTETTVAVTAIELAPPRDRPVDHAQIASQEVPIGHPMEGVRAYVLDDAGESVPVGEVGELHIAGRCVAREYLNDPALTAERFVERPSFLPQEDRVYKTGDLVRTRADGALEFVGRVDGQVQLRGMRVELGEVEQALAQHPSIGQAAVVARDDGTAKRLVAYCSLRDGAQEPSRAELRVFLLRTLAPFMVPATFMVLDELPLNANDKVDRTSLPEPEPGQRSLATPYSEPRTAVEREVAAVWERVLDLDQVGRADRFVDLGGDSLTAIEILSGLHQAFHCDLTFAALRTADTVAEVARLVEPGRAAARDRMAAERGE